MQPRDELGQFACYSKVVAKDVCDDERIHLYRGISVDTGDVPSRDQTTDLIVVDESNSFSSMIDGKRRNLTVVCTRVHDRRAFDKIIREIPVKGGQRTKYSNTKEPQLSRIVKTIASQDVTVVESHRPISPESVKGPQAKKDLYVSVLSDSIRKAVDVDSSKPSDVIIDTPPLKVNKELIVLGKDLSTDGRVRWFVTKRSASTPSLQVHDYVTGVISDNVESIESKHHLYKILEKCVKK